MKRFLILLAFSICSFWASGQVDVVLHMDQRLNGLPFTYQTAVRSDIGYYFTASRLQYYVSGIKLIHDGGIETPVADKYLLIDPAEDAVFELGNFPINTLEQIRFAIGVDSAHNHLDPSGYPSDHPLAPQNPSMHWGWKSGYRFIAMEGYASTDSTAINNNYQLHTIGDANYHIVTLDMGGEANGDNLVINIRADYEHFLDGIDASGGIISHSTSGAARQVIQNSRGVFSPGETTGVVEPGIQGTFIISPNPALDATSVRWDIPGFEEITFILSDITGRTVYAKELEEPDSSFSLDIRWPSGIYIARLVSPGRLLALEKLVVQ